MEMIYIYMCVCVCVCVCIVAYLFHARKVEAQNQPFLYNTRTNNGTAGLRNPFLGYGPVNTVPRRRMRTHSNSTDWVSHDLSTARYSLRNNRTEFSVRGRCEGYITRLSAGPDARCERTGWLPAVSVCSALLCSASSVPLPDEKN
jgi:hypothetical protein